MQTTLGNILIYTKRVDAVAQFYCTHFGFDELRLKGDRIVELVPQNGGAHIMLHPMNKGRKEGQTLVKIGFSVQDVEAFCEQAMVRGLKFGPIHRADGYIYANAKDPAKNSIAISSRAFVKR